MQKHGPTFRYRGRPVGYWTSNMKPIVAGEYGYVPFRGVGHLQLQLTLKEGRTARVTCNYGGSDTEIDVVACPRYGVVTIGDPVS